jgi:hypothetical protein
MTTNPRPCTGRLLRDADVSGVTDVGHVADVVIWPDGTAAVRWLGDYPTTVHHDHGRESVDHIHGHSGSTRIVWDNPWYAPPDLRVVQANVEDALQGEIEHWDDAPMREALWTVLGHVQPLVSEVAALRQQLAEADQRAELLRRQVADLTDTEDELADLLEAGTVQNGVLANALADLASAREEAAAEHREHTASAANWRSRIGEAADCLDIAGHHETARMLRQDASIPAKPVPSAYADNHLPVPLEDRHRDALAAIALTDLGRPEVHASALIDLARQALGLDTPQQEVSRG